MKDSQALSGTLLRASVLWEIGRQMSASPMTGGERGSLDVCIAVGDGSGERFEPRLRMSTGTPLLAHAVVRGDLDVGFVNPAPMLTQAFRGKGIFTAPLPVRVLATYPSWDRFVCAIHPRTGIASLPELRERQYPLRLSIREDPCHATRPLIDEMLAAYGITLADIQAWGGSLETIGGPRDARRIDALAAGTLDAVFDEGVRSWVEAALASGMRPLALGEPALGRLESIGWQRAVLPAQHVAGLAEDYVGIDFSGWAIYTRAELPEALAYEFCAALAARADTITWDVGYTGITQLGQNSDAAPRVVPLHPGAARWYREQGVEV
jgi:TRAP-type uncharacterized transport system substrate-binding protein